MCARSDRQGLSAPVDILHSIILYPSQATASGRPLHV